jgi:hypothetical protein
MRQEDERGFLSGKFDDWSGEPIPNGWNSLDRKITAARYRRNALLAAVPVLFFLSFLPALRRIDFSSGAENSGNKVSVQPTSESGASPAKRAFGSSGNAKIHQSAESVPGEDLMLVASTAESGAPDSDLKLPPSGKATSIQKAACSTFYSSATEEGNSLVISSDDGQGMSASNAEAADDGLLAEEKQDGTASAIAGSAFRSEVLPMALKTALLSETASQLKINFSPKIWQTESTTKIPGPGFQKSFSVQAAYAVTSVQLHHAQTEGWKYGIQNSRFTTAGAVSAGLRMEKPISRNFAVFYGLETGIWLRRIEWMASSRTAHAFEYSRTSATSYAVSPVVKSQMEQRNSMLVFARSEIGIRKAISRRTGFLAAAQLWARISSRGFTDLENGASFTTAREAIKPGYRFGIWWQAGTFTQAELSFSSSPESLAPTTAGAEFNSRLLSLGLRQSF